MKTKHQAGPVIQMLDPEHERIRVSIALYDAKDRRYREHAVFKLRVDQSGRDALIEKIRERLGTLGT
jgi:hypothetical protein